MQLSVFFIRSRRLQILTGAACAVALMAGCAIAPPQVPVKPPRPAGTAQNWVGTYRGTVPCTPPASSCTSERIALTDLPSRLPEHETAFALTVHKSQGSEFAHTLLVLPDQDNPVLTRELLYTGITRAKQRLDLFAPLPLLQRTIAKCTQRSSGLTRMLLRP